MEYFNQIRVLNYTNGETMDYPFVLLEGEIGNDSSQENRDEKSLGLREISTITTQHDMQHEYVLVSTAEDCRRWPVTRGGFKALITLNIGENPIKLKACIDNTFVEQEFKLMYEPSALKRFVRVVYIKCSDSDGSFQAPPGVLNDEKTAVKKLGFNARLLQTFTAQDLHHHGFGHKTFRLEEDETGNPKIHVFTSTLTSEDALAMTGGQLYDTFSSELTKSHLYNPLCKFWTFMSCTRYIPPPPEEFKDKDIHLYAKAHTALGGGHLALFGTGNLHTWASGPDDLMACFTNTSMIDRRSLFDDSARRGSYWANYATGLGASMHELGHCFDLAHTPGGIMGRGFDDFNCVFSLWKNPPQTCSMKHKNISIEFEDKQEVPQDTHITAKGLVQATGNPNPPHDSNFMYDDTNMAKPGGWSHGAKWYRSSAVILRYHKWFNKETESVKYPTVHWSYRLFGPVGVMSDAYDCNKTSFNDKKWLYENDAVLCGYVIHADNFVNSIQTIGRKSQAEKGVEIHSKPHGQEIGRKYIFKIEESDEHVTGIDVRAGAWIDAIQIHTNYKSSIQMGGKGGCLNHFEPSNEQSIMGMFGCAGEYVGSIGIFLESLNNTSTVSSHPPDDEDLLISAPNGLRLIELHDKVHQEVYKHWEFLDSTPPTEFTLNRDEIVTAQARVVIMDDMGNLHSSGPFHDLENILKDFKSETKTNDIVMEESHQSSLVMLKTSQGILKRKEFEEAAIKEPSNYDEYEPSQKRTSTFKNSDDN